MSCLTVSITYNYSSVLLHMLCVDYCAAECAVMECPVNSGCLVEGGQPVCRCNDGFQRNQGGDCVGEHTECSTMWRGYEIMMCCLLQILMSVSWVFKRMATTVLSTPLATTPLDHLTVSVILVLTWPSRLEGPGNVKVST